MNLELNKKRALVCGSSQGIGRAIAFELADLGAELTLVARNQDSLKDVLQSLSTHSQQKHRMLPLDFSNTSDAVASVSKAIAEDGDFQILVNNSGGPQGGPILEASSSAFQNAFVQHLVMNHELVKLCLPGMKKANYGRILNIISTSVKEPIQGLGVSNTIRAAVAAWAKTLSKEIMNPDITINNILPGFTDTARLGALFENKAKKLGVSKDQVSETALKTVPLGRFAKAEEVGAAAAFLCSPAAAYINGQSLSVDGGRLNGI